MRPATSSGAPGRAGDSAVDELRTGLAEDALEQILALLLGVPAVAQALHHRVGQVAHVIGEREASSATHQEQHRDRHGCRALAGRALGGSGLAGRGQAGQQFDVVDAVGLEGEQRRADRAARPLRAVALVGGELRFRDRLDREGRRVGHALRHRGAVGRDEGHATVVLLDGAEHLAPSQLELGVVVSGSGGHVAPAGAVAR